MHLAALERLDRERGHAAASFGVGELVLAGRDLAIASGCEVATQLGRGELDDVIPDLRAARWCRGGAEAIASPAGKHRDQQQAHRRAHHTPPVRTTDWRPPAPTAPRRLRSRRRPARASEWSTGPTTGAR